MFPLIVVAFPQNLSFSLWLFLHPEAIITECIVIIRKSVLQLECQRKLVYVMNALSHLFPVLEADHFMQDFFESMHRLLNSQKSQGFTSSMPKCTFQRRQHLDSNTYIQVVSICQRQISLDLHQIVVTHRYQPCK